MAASSIIFILFALLISLHNGVQRTRYDIDCAFKEAIDKNYNSRLLYMSYARPESVRHDVMRYIITPAEKGKVKNYIFKSKKGNTIITLKDSLDKEVGKRLINEYIFSQVYPINLDELDSLFHERLKRRHVKGKTGIVYYSEKAPRYSDNDSIVPASAYCTPRYTLDITEKIKVQAWVDYQFSTIIGHTNNIVWWFIILFALTSAFFIYYNRKRKDIKNVEVTPPAPKGIEIDFEKQELHIDGVLCNIQKLDLMLLDIFLRKVGICVDREDIKQAFWPTDDNANEKIDAHIKAIRKILKDFPEYQLITVRGKGYYLTRGE